MKTVSTILILGVVTLFCGCKPHLTSDQKKQLAELDNYIATNAVAEKAKSERDDFAREVMLREITNDVVGLRSLIFTLVNTDDADTNKWSGFATLEYFNHFGGVDRTNMNFRFHVVTNEPFTMLLCAPTR
jgi:hypothetical protein